MFETLETTLAKLEAQSDTQQQLLTQVLTLLNGGVDPNEPPINSEELMKRLQISRPTLIRMRKQKKLPFMHVGGVIRYDWYAVKKAFEK